MGNTAILIERYFKNKFYYKMSIFKIESMYSSHSVFKRIEYFEVLFVISHLYPIDFQYACNS